MLGRKGPRNMSCRWHNEYRSHADLTSQTFHAYPNFDTRSEHTPPGCFIEGANKREDR